MAIVYTKTDQGLKIATGTGAPVHSAVAGDRYTDTATGVNYMYVTAWLAISNKNLRINNQAGNYTATITDFNTDTITRMTSASANNYTIPLNATVDFPIGTQLLVAQIGAGQTTIVATVGVTINATGLKISATKNAVTLIKVGTDEWDAFGNLTA
jgi:hypothetical protein